MGILDFVQDWLAPTTEHEVLAALVGYDELFTGAYGRIIYTADPRFQDDVVYLTRLACRLQALWHEDYVPKGPVEESVRSMLMPEYRHDGVVLLPPAFSGSDAVFLHDLQISGNNIRGWVPWHPARNVRRIVLSARGRFLRVLPHELGDAERLTRRRIHLLRSRGARVVKAWVAQANAVLYGEGDDDAPGVVIFSEDPQVSRETLVNLSSRLHALRDTPRTPAEFSDALDLLRANCHSWRYHRRARAVPTQPVYVADLWFTRAFLSRGFLSDRNVECLAELGDSGGIELLPFDGEQAPPDLTWDASWIQWNDGCVLRMAQSLRETLDPTDLQILGDALEESGCNEPAILEHCRAGRPHHGDCWVVESLISLAGERSRSPL